MGQQSLIYSFVARGTVVLAEFTGNFTSIASQCLQKLPSSNNKFTYNCDGHTFNYLVEDGFSLSFFLSFFHSIPLMQDFLQKTNAKDASGNIVFGDIGVHLQHEVLLGIGEIIASRSCPKVLLLNGIHDRETSGFSAACFVTAIGDALNRTYGDPHNCLKNHVSLKRFLAWRPTILQCNGRTGGDG